LQLNGCYSLYSIRNIMILSGALCFSISHISRSIVLGSA
jgi:hypothetical protein